MAIKSLRRKKRFQKEYNDLTNHLKSAADDTMRDLLANPIPAGKRFHSLKGISNPKVYTIDVTPDRAYKISLEIDGEVATLRRIATHKEIDRAP